MLQTNENSTNKKVNPVESSDMREDDLLERYPDPAAIASAKATEAYRNYETPGRDTIKEFYKLNHTHQTYAFVQEKKQAVL